MHNFKARVLPLMVFLTGVIAASGGLFRGH